MASDKKKNDDILTQSREGLRRAIDVEQGLRSEMQDDLRFSTLDQWPTAIRNQRQNDPNGPRPCLTIDKSNQYIVQVMNDIRQNRPAIKVRPVDDKADLKTAKVLQGIIRHIESQSKAHIAYETAAESTLRIGLGFFRVLTEYESDKGRNQTLTIVRVPNTFSVYLGPHLMPDGSDAKEAWIFEQMTKAEFKRRHPKAKASSDDFEVLPADARTFWADEETVTVCEYFYVEETFEKKVWLDSGEEMAADAYEALPDTAESPRAPVESERTITHRKVCWVKHTGVEVLDKRDLPGKYIPVIEVVGREAFVDGRRILWGLVRPAKDSLRQYNYIASTITEKTALAPKAPFIAAAGQIEEFEDIWKSANRENYAVLPYSPIAVDGTVLPAPKRQEPTQLEAGLVAMLQLAEHDVQTSLGMFKAAVGEAESQQSGRAILALQRESDTATFHFADNLANSIAHLGRILVDLIPHYYDARRVVRILGEDDSVQTVTIDPEQQESARDVQQPGGGVMTIYNPGVGSFDVTTTVGPSYNTKRMEGAAVFTELAKGASDPGSAAVLRYLTVKNSDFTNSEEASNALKALLPPPVQMALQSEDGPIPPKAMMKINQMQAAMAQMQEQGGELAKENQQLKAGTQAKMMQVQADSQASQQELSFKAQLQQQQQAFDEQMAKRKQALAEWVAQQDAALAREKAAFEAQCKEQEQEREHKFRSQEQAFKLSEKGKADESTSQLVQMFLKGLEMISQQNQQGLQAIAEAVAKPKVVNLGNFKRGPDGDITGASARVN